MHLRATKSTSLSPQIHLCLAAAPRVFHTCIYHLLLWIALLRLFKISFGPQKSSRDFLRVLATRSFMIGISMQLLRAIVTARAATSWLYLRVRVSLQCLWMSNAWSRTVEWAPSNTLSAKVNCVVQSFVHTAACRVSPDSASFILWRP